jgi:hypothetical protein
MSRSQRCACNNTCYCSLKDEREQNRIESSAELEGPAKGELGADCEIQRGQPRASSFLSVQQSLARERISYRLYERYLSTPTAYFVSTFASWSCPPWARLDLGAERAPPLFSILYFTSFTHSLSLA